jgi:hypothetical protein
MGTRLYPITTNPRKLEKLAGVPAGTWEVYRELEKQFPEQDEFYAALDEPKNESVARLFHFDLFGWGKFLFIQNFSPCGRTKTFKEARKLARLNGLSTREVRLANGFKWS